MKALITILLLLSLPVYAFEYEPKLSDKKKEKQAQELFTELRCIVCDGESLSGSNAEFSIDMRALIREKLKNGESKKEITEFLIARYGNAILQKPPLKTSTYLLWFSPLILLLVGVFVVIRARRNES